MTAARAAYEHGDEWYEKMLGYVKENITYVKQYVHENLPGVDVVEGEEPISYGLISEKPELRQMNLTEELYRMQNCG